MRTFILILLAVLLGVGISRWHAWTIAKAIEPQPTSSPTALIVEEEAPNHPRPSWTASDMDPVSARTQVEQFRARNEAAAERVVTAGRNKLVGAFNGETIDQAWAANARSELSQFATSQQIHDLHAEPLSMDVDCRRTVCRIGADFATRAAANDWATLYLTSVGARMPNASLQTSDNADGTAHLEVYGSVRM